MTPVARLSTTTSGIPFPTFLAPSSPRSLRSGPDSRIPPVRAPLAWMSCTRCMGPSFVSPPMSYRLPIFWPSKRCTARNAVHEITSLRRTAPWKPKTFWTAGIGKHTKNTRSCLAMCSPSRAIFDRRSDLQISYLGGEEGRLGHVCLRIVSHVSLDITAFLFMGEETVARWETKYHMTVFPTSTTFSRLAV